MIDKTSIEDFPDMRYKKQQQQQNPYFFVTMGWKFHTIVLLK